MTTLRHGMHKTPEYNCWRNMRSRCQSPAWPGYKNYGGRGIKVCDRWQLFENFFSDMGPRPSEKHSIDRENNDGDYEPSNCCWAVAKSQMNNRRCSYTFNIRGLTFQSVTDAANTFGVTTQTIRQWTLGRARNGRFEPPRSGCSAARKYQ